MKPVLVLLIFYAVMSVVCLVLYAADKKRAQKGKWRIKERTLLLTGFLGGAVGALIGMQVFRHKTKHWYFWAVNMLGLAVQIALAVFLLLRK